MHTTEEFPTFENLVNFKEGNKFVLGGEDGKA